jgi:hypothetical protein
MFWRPLVLVLVPITGNHNWTFLYISQNFHGDDIRHSILGLAMVYGASSKFDDSETDCVSIITVLVSEKMMMEMDSISENADAFTPPDATVNLRIFYCKFRGFLITCYNRALPGTRPPHVSSASVNLSSYETLRNELVEEFLLNLSLPN